MDRSLDDRIAERQRGGYPRRGDRNEGRLNDYDAHQRPRLRDSYRKPDNTRTPDDAWVHDRFEGDRFSAPRRAARTDRYDLEDDLPSEPTAKLKIENLHYDLGEKDLRDLFTRKGPIESLELLYDRAGRSRGTAFVTYASLRDAELAIREYDGANAYGQPIKLTLMPKGPTAIARRGGGLSGRVEGRSLFERTEVRRRRSESPRRSNVTKPPPEGVDRYIPGESRRRRNSRSRSPLRNNRESRGPRGGRATRGREAGRGGRPKVTAKELDAEMNDYFGGSTQPAQNGTSSQTVESSLVAAPHVVTAPVDDDVDMIE